MKTRRSLFVLTLILLVVAVPSINALSGIENGVYPSIRVLNHGMSKGLAWTRHGLPIPSHETASFEANDTYAYDYVVAAFYHVTWTWVWYTPDNQVYSSQSWSDDCEAYPCADASVIPIASARADTMPGNWHVTLLADNYTMYTDNFTIAAVPIPADSPIQVLDHGLAEGLKYTHGVTTAPVNTTAHFTTNDTAAYAYARVTFFGAYFNWQWYAPDGSLFLSDSPPPAYCSASPSCLIASGIRIADSAASTMLGAWRVTLVANNATLYSDNFTISPSNAVEVLDHGLARGLEYSDGAISAPVNATTHFTTDDHAAYAYARAAFYYVRFTWQWYAPDGTLFYSDSPPLAYCGASPSCYTASGIRVAGSAASLMPGVWHVTLLAGNVTLYSDNFTIAPPNPT